MDKLRYILLFFMVIIGFKLIKILIKSWLEKRNQAQEHDFDSNDDSTSDPGITEDPLMDNHDLVLGDPTLASLGFGDIKNTDEKKLMPKPDNQPASPNMILMLYLMAPVNRPFVGYEFYQSLISLNLHYGVMKIFHRHKQADGSGRILFSVAAATEPGSFDLSNIGALQCLGLCFFMDLRKTNTLRADFNEMLASAEQLHEILGGELQDHKHQPLTEQNLSVYHKKIIEHYQQLLAETA